MRSPLLIALSCLFGFTFCLAQSEPLKLVGSDLLANHLDGALERYEAQSGQAVEVDMIGSLPAMTDMSEGRAGVGILAIPVDEPLPEDRYTLIPLTYQVAYVIVNTGNPIIEMSLPQLSGMFSADPQVRIERWGQTGQTGPISSRSVQVFVEDAPGSVAVEMFKYIVLESRSIKSNATVVATNRGLGELVAADLGAVGLGSRPPVLNTTKAVALSSGAPGSFAFGPTPENVYYGDYLLRLPIFIAIPKGKETPKALVKEFLSAETASELTKAGFMPLPENVRKRAIQDLDR